VLFDWDDTLCGIVPHRYETIQGVHGRLGLVAARQDVHRAWLAADDPVVDRIGSGFWHRFAAGLGMHRHSSLIEALSQEFERRDSYRRLTLYDDVLDLLDDLQADDWQLAVVSNNVDAATRINELGLADRFATIVTPRDTGGVGKPDPTIFWLALERLAVEARHAVYIGDTYEHDVAGARAAGIQALLVDRLELAKPVDCEVLDSLIDARRHLALGGRRRR
jgi:putative hydrolase of the HAD superfamily